MLSIQMIFSIIGGAVGLLIGIMIFSAFVTNAAPANNTVVNVIGQPTNPVIAYASTEAAGHPASNVIDGNPATYWQN